jgi:glyoxylate/hydroxypyruvate reductase A
MAAEMEDPMAILFQCPWDNAPDWISLLRARLAGRELRIHPNLGAPEDIAVALVWKPPAGLLADLPNLRLVQSLGAGVDFLLESGEVPAGVPVARLVDPLMATRMAEYVLAAVLRVERRFDAYARQQAEGLWRRLPQCDAPDVRVGIMGSGVLGARAAQVLTRHGFRVATWSRTVKDLPGIESFAGPEGLAPFLGRSDHLVCLLPLTDATRGLLDARTLGLLPKGAHVVNCARGTHVVDADLLWLLDEGHMAAATLDVFVEEPLPPDHPFWHHPKVFVTPHVSSITEPATAVAQIAENVERLTLGAPLINLVDRAIGY